MKVCFTNPPGKMAFGFAFHTTRISVLGYVINAPTLASVTCDVERETSSIPSLKPFPILGIVGPLACGLAIFFAILGIMVWIDIKQQRQRSAQLRRSGKTNTETESLESLRRLERRFTLLREEQVPADKKVLDDMIQGTELQAQMNLGREIRKTSPASWVGSFCEQVCGEFYAVVGSKEAPRAKSKADDATEPVMVKDANKMRGSSLQRKSLLGLATLGVAGKEKDDDWEVVKAPEKANE
jgi:hypothetical protein